jgi:hypothetical protein
MSVRSFLRPFNFEIGAAAYLDLANSFHEKQQQLCAITSLVVFTYFFSILSAVVASYYLSSAGSGKYSAVMRSVTEAGIVVIPFSVIMYSFLGLNEKADSMVKSCSKLIATSSASSKNIRSFKDETETSPNSCDDGLLSENGPTTNGARLLSVFQDHGEDALKMRALLMRKKCELRLLGRKLSGSDLVAIGTTIAATQIIRSIGLGNAPIA